MWHATARRHGRVREAAEAPDRRVEVTQSIQTTTTSVRLAQRKPTVVRVTVRHGLAGFGGNAVPGVKGRIRVRPRQRHAPGWFDAANGSSPMAATPAASITVVANPQRNTPTTRSTS